MDLSALVLSRLQFAFTVSFHIIFPSFTIGLAAWLTVLEALHLARPGARRTAYFLSSGSDFWHRLRAWCRLRHRDGLRVRYKLERALARIGKSSHERWELIRTTTMFTTWPNSSVRPRAH
jgi:Cytochrome bd terminal oxidase subunit I